MSFRLPFLAASALSLFALLPAEANAAALPSIAGAACEVISGPALMTAARVRFISGRVGTVVVNCAISQEDAQLLTGIAPFLATYRDSTGTATAASVKVGATSVSKLNGASATITVFDSNNYAATTATRKVGTVLLASNPDFYHFIRVELKRATTAQIVEFYGGYFAVP